MYKRKHRRSAAPTHDRGSDNLRTFDDTDFDPSLYIVAYEADIVSGPRAVSAALALECPEALPDGADKTNAGSGLIHLEPQNRTLVFDDDDGSVKARREPIHPHLLVDRYVFLILSRLCENPCTVEVRPLDGANVCGMNRIDLTLFLLPNALWTRLREWSVLRARGTLCCSLALCTHTKLLNRYDVRLLLDAIPTVHDHPSLPSPFTAAIGHPRPLSPSGWSELPSDTEDTFFFSPDEAEDYRRDKRRKLIDHAREERMRAILARDREREGATGEDSEVWGGSDEEPDETQKELLRRTAVHVVSSPNPAQLEMRILANHGADKRFAFLRGRWSRAWKASKELARQEQREAQKAEKLSGCSSLQGLIADYGDSEGSGDEPSEGEAVEDKAMNVSKPLVRELDSASPDEADRQKARRERAREWSARRRAEQLSNEEQG
ncbi:hypothetical protein EDC04DRAFT_3138098 [Pisolithus marmoratus]|nr:hypothetical protein EDC04DRAFT_3138098 [Pisolithus marmoratus]